MVPELHPYPLRTKKHGIIAARYAQAIQKNGFNALVLERIREMCEEPVSTDLTGRILRNTCLAFSVSQVRKLVIREIVVVTGKRWISSRKERK